MLGIVRSHYLGSCFGVFNDRHVPMVIAVITLGMVKVSVDEVVDMVAVWHRLVPTVDTVLVGCIMAIAVMTVGAVGWVLGVYFKGVFIHMPFVRRMKMPVVKVVGVVVMLDRCVAAFLAVLVGVIFVYYVLSCHCGTAILVGKLLGNNS